MRTVRLHRPYLLLQLPLDVSSKQGGSVHYGPIHHGWWSCGTPLHGQTDMTENITFPQIHWQVEINRVKVHPAGTSVISAFSEGFYNDGPWGNIFWNIHKWPTHLSPWHPLIFIFLILFYIYKLNKYVTDSEINDQLTHGTPDQTLNACTYLFSSFFTKSIFW